MLLTSLKGLNAAVALLQESCNPEESVLPLLVVGHWLCTEGLRTEIC